MQVSQYPQFTISNYSSTHARPKDMYYVAFPKDFLKSKVLVYGVDALEIPQTIIFARRVMGTLQLITIWIVWFSIPLMSGIGTSNKLIHCSTAESPSFFQKLLSWLKRSTPMASASFPIPWSFQVRFYLYTIFFEAVDILF